MKSISKRIGVGLAILIAIAAVFMASVLTLRITQEPVVQAVPEVVVPLPTITHEDLLAATNALRPTPLLEDPALDATAATKCADMVAKDYWAHGDWMSFMTQLHRKAYGENLSMGNPAGGGQEVVDGWHGSPEHYENIMRTNFTKVGFAVCDFRGGKLIVQHFSTD